MMAKMIKLPYLLDFYHIQGEEYTKIQKFFDNLKEGRLTTTKCKGCGKVLWQPRIVCPSCNSDEMEWIDLPKEGELFAFTASVLGAPMGMVEDAPFCIGIIDLKDPEVRILSRIDDAEYDDLEIGKRMRLKVIELEDGRVWFRFVPGE